ncbi:MAG: flavin reductase family protein [Bdellovibrionales bacterium]
MASLEKIKAVDKDKYTSREWIKMINSLSGFKSANLIGTSSKEGESNLCIVSSVFHIGANPPLMGFVLRPHSNESPSHTLLNIEDTKFFTINHVNEKIYERGHQTSARYPQEVSEFKECNLTEESGFDAPYVKEANVKIGLKFTSRTDIHENNTHMVIGKVVEFMVPDGSVYEDGHIDLEGAGSIVVSGLDSYHKTQILSRLSYAKPGVQVNPIKVSAISKESK